MRGLWVRQKGTRGRYAYFADNWKGERRHPTMKEGDIYESLLDGTEYVVKRIVNKMVLLQERKGNWQILTGVGTLETKSFYQEKEKKVNK